MTKLSICIATRNRAKVIGETLDSLLCSISDEVEILVLDGASTDDTERVLGEYTRRSPQLRYVRLSSNGGVDLDYHRAVEQASGEFCWLMTDDDVADADAIPRILAKLGDAIDLLIVNSRVCNEDFSRVLQTKRLEIDRDHQFEPGEFEAFFRLATRYLSFIGAVVIRRSTWLARRKEPYLGTEFIHCGIIFQRPLERRIVVMAEPLLSIRYGVAQWSSRAFQIWMFKWPELVWSFDAFSDAAKAAVVAREPWRDLRMLLYYRARGQYTLDVYERELMPKTDSALARLAQRTVARIPAALWCNAVAIGAALLLPRHGIIHVDLRGSPHYRPELKPITERVSAFGGRLLQKVGAR
jgi:glycosyltransferase involved in cell wall biosynthesis